MFLTNDLLEGGAASESVTKITDSNNRVIYLVRRVERGGVLRHQEELGLVDACLPGWNLPGVINLPGPDVNFASFASNARFVYGYAPGDVGKSGNTHCHPMIAVSTDAPKRKVDAIMCTPGNCSSGQYTSCGAFANPAFSCPTNNNGNGNGMVQSAGGSGGSVGAAFNPSTLNFMRTRSNPYDRWICLTEKGAGKPYDGKPHVRFDVAGDGKVLWRT